MKEVPVFDLNLTEFSFFLAGEITQIPESIFNTLWFRQLSCLVMAMSRWWGLNLHVEEKHARVRTFAPCTSFWHYSALGTPGVLYKCKLKGGIDWIKPALCAWTKEWCLSKLAGVENKTLFFLAFWTNWSSIYRKGRLTWGKQWVKQGGELFLLLRTL